MFTTTDTTQYSTTRPPSFDVIGKYVKLDYNIIEAYYRNRDTRINNTNILVRLIKKLTIDVNKEFMEYINLIDIDYKYKSKAMNITSELNRGVIFTNIIGDTTSIIEQKFVNIFEANDYRNISTIKILKTDSTDLAMNHPNNITNGNFVLMIDIPATMVQYKYWSMDRMSIGEDVSQNIFVFQVLYTNMIKDIFDFSLYNRFHKTVYIEPSISKHPFLVRNNDTRFNKVLAKQYNNLKNNNIDYRELLVNIPTVFTKNAYRLLSFTPIDINRQNIWLVYLARVEVILNIIYFSGKKGVNRNRDKIVDFRLFMREVRFNKILDSVNWKTLDLKMSILYNEALSISKNRGI